MRNTLAMTPKALSAIIACGEDSRHQFKRDCTQVESLAAELAAFANMGGGQLLVGVSDNGNITGLTLGDISRLNQLLSNAASQHVKPPINPTSTNVKTPQGLVMVIDVPEGLNKPYVDTHGRIWVKSGADKRQVTAREEMQRMFQQSGLLHADEQAIGAATLDNLDQTEFAKYFERRYGKPLASTGMPLERLLQNLNLGRNGVPNLTGMLLFGKSPHHLLPAFIVKAVAFPGTVLHDSHYQDSQDIEGTLAEQYERSLAFIKRNLHYVQGNRSFNSPGQLEIPIAAFEEIMVNALVHRDYLISATIRLLIYIDRVEIISPGHLPNHLDTEQIRFGLSNLRNPALASHAFHILPYRGLGSGIKRATDAWQQIEFIDDRQGNQFRVILKRPAVQIGGVNETIGGVNTENEGVNQVNWGVNSEAGGVNETIWGVNDLIDVIRRNPGLRAPALASLMGLTPKKVEHWIKQLRTAGRLEFVGSPKTGGYHCI